MVTADSVKAKLEGLIAKANGITGKADSDLSAAVDSLAAGFGQSEDTLAARLSNSLTVYVNPSLTRIADYGFYQCTSLQKVSCPNVTAFGQYAFSGCTALTEFDFSNVKLQMGYGSAYAFEGSGLVRAVLPKTTILPYNVFQGCAKLEMVDCHVASAVQMQAFRYCNSLTTLIFRKSDSPVGINVNMLDNSGFGPDSRVCGVYVPAALIERYQTDTNWSALYEGGMVAFFAIEGSEFE